MATQNFHITLAIFTALLAYEKTPKRLWIWLFFVNIYPFIIGALLYGGVFGLEVVETHNGETTGHINYRFGWYCRFFTYILCLGLGRVPKCR